MTTVEILGEIMKAREGEIFLDISSPLPHTLGTVTEASLIAELEAKVKHYRQRVEEYRSKLRVWESALKSALEETAASKPKKAERVLVPKGKVSRAFVREVIKRHAENGVTPKQIREAAEQQRLAFKPNFPYAILHKFRTHARPEVKEVGGRYFPISPEEAEKGD